LRVRRGVHARDDRRWGRFRARLDLRRGLTLFFEGALVFGRQQRGQHEPEGAPPLGQRIRLLEGQRLVGAPVTRDHLDLQVRVEALRIAPRQTGHHARSLGASGREEITRARLSLDRSDDDLRPGTERLLCGARQGGRERRRGVLDVEEDEDDEGEHEGGA
jgi:hypothetical protein